MITGDITGDPNRQTDGDKGKHGRHVHTQGIYEKVTSEAETHGER